MKIKVSPFLSRKGNRVAQAAIEFDSGVLNGFQLVGFTICDDAEKGLFVLFPSANTNREKGNKLFFFLRPSSDGLLEKLETAILDVYESMIAFNAPRVVNDMKG